jgi:hypothetical protein
MLTALASRGIHDGAKAARNKTQNDWQIAKWHTGSRTRNFSWHAIQTQPRKNADRSTASTLR